MITRIIGLQEGAKMFSWHTKIPCVLLLTGACLMAGGLKAQEVRRALPPNTANTTVTAPSQQSPTQTRSTPDDQAKFLAGISVSSGSRLDSLQDSTSYLQHARTFSRTWANFEDTHFSKMRTWSQAELQPKVPAASVLLYMFGGPDFINAFALFPNMPVIILCGLEPVGKIPAPEQLDEARLAQDLATLRAATDSTLKWSFFIRKDMKNDLLRGDFQGVVPILYTFLALSGNFIERTDFISPSGGLPGVRITYRKGPSSPIQTLYYINANLGNDSARSGGALFTWFASFGSSIAYLKAASYLMHDPYFSNVRDFLLSRCSAILQDDSGIPFRYFSSDRWQIYLYGKYSRPIELFKTKYQQDLRAAYQTSGTVQSLPFGTGYQWRPGESNLMLAVRKTGGSSQSTTSHN